MKFTPMKSAFVKQIIVVAFISVSSTLFSQTNFGAHVGYEFLPSNYFSPSQEQTFNPSLYKMESFVTYNGNMAPSIGFEMTHKVDRKTFFRMELDYVYNRAQYTVSSSRYSFLYEGNSGQLTFENHGINLSLLYGFSSYQRRAKKTKATFYIGGVIGANVHQDLQKPTSEFKDEYNYYFLNQDQINKIVYGATFQFNYKLRYKGRGRSSKYANIDVYSRVYAHGLVKQRDGETSAMFVPGIKIGFDL